MYIYIYTYDNDIRKHPKKYGTMKSYNYLNSGKSWFYLFGGCYINDPDDPV